MLNGEINVIGSQANIQVNLLLEEANRISAQITAEQESKGNAEIAKAEVRELK